MGPYTATAPNIAIAVAATAAAATAAAATAAAATAVAATAAAATAVAATAVAAVVLVPAAVSAGNDGTDRRQVPIFLPPELHWL